MEDGSPNDIQLILVTATDSSLPSGNSNQDKFCKFGFVCLSTSFERGVESDNGRDWNFCLIIISSWAVLPVPGGPVMYSESDLCSEIAFAKKFITCSYSAVLAGNAPSLLFKLTSSDDFCKSAFVLRKIDCEPNCSFSGDDSGVTSVNCNFFLFKGRGGVAGASSNRFFLIRLVGVIGIADMNVYGTIDENSAAQCSEYSKIVLPENIPLLYK